MNFIGSNRILAAFAQVSSWVDSAIAAKNALTKPMPSKAKVDLAAADPESEFISVADSRAVQPRNPEEERAKFKLVVSGKDRILPGSTNPNEPISDTIRGRIEQALDRQSELTDYSDVMELMNDTLFLSDTLSTAHSNAQAQKSLQIVENLIRCVDLMHNKLESLRSFKVITDYQFIAHHLAHFEQILNTGLMETLDYAFSALHKSALLFSPEKRQELLGKILDLESSLDKLVQLTNSNEVAEKVGDLDSNYLHSIRAKLSLGLIG